MRVEKKFTEGFTSPYDNLTFEIRKSEIKNTDGTSASQSLQITVPENWSQVATDIMAQKYLRRAGVPEIGAESDSRQVFHRLAGCWADWGRRYGYFDTDEDAKNFYDETCFMLANQMAAPNSPQWFNTGLYFAYGIKGKGQGHYYVDPDSGKVCKSKSAYERPQPHACFIQSIQDDLVNDGGIMDLWTREGRLFKYGSGTGTNFSNIRGEGESLSGGGYSSGLMSFLKIGDRAAGAIKSGGTTRRAAKMVCLDVDHPDIKKFVNWKVKEEQKVAALVAGSKTLEKSLNAILSACAEGISLADDRVRRFDPKQNKVLARAISEARKCFVPGAYIQRTIDLAKQGITDVEIETYDTDWNSEAYSSVSGQNSNNSVRITNEFMKAVEDGAKWQLRFRTNGEVAAEMEAGDLWDDIAAAAWACADPGLQFDTTINEWHTCPQDGRINASNPCSEYMFLDDTACNLASLNLLKFYDEEKGEFDVSSFKHACHIWTIILDISVQMAQFPSREIAQKSWDFRTLGLGYANIGALLMRQGMPYGSKESLAFTGALTAIMCAQAYKTSAKMAKELGAFPGYKRNKKDMLRVIRNHRTAAHAGKKFHGLTIKPMSIHHKFLTKDLSNEVKNLWDEALEHGEQYGFRNAQVTVIAPTGTIGLLMDCDTTGIEPDFALVKYKKLAGGGYFKIINQSVPAALDKLGYEPKQIENIINYCMGFASLRDAPNINWASLQDKGFDKETLHKVEKELHGTFDINFVFNKWSLGEEFCKDSLGLSDEQLADPKLSILKALGFSDQDIVEANEYVCGAMTLEGAPHVKDQHLAVFDCANKCGLKGSRYISSAAHIDIMAAAQPFISGAISKTINLPYEASIGDIKEAYHSSWRKMLKSNALYRDGSKLSQPLNASTFDFSDEDLAEDNMHEQIREIATKVVTEYVSKKRPLPSRRRGYTQKVKIGGHSIYLRTGEYADGKLGEIFLDINKEGTLLRSMMNCFAMSVSMGLQYGVPLSNYVNTFTFARFEPNGLVFGHDKIKNSTSIIDFIFRDLAINYLDRYDLAHVKPDEMEQGVEDEILDRIDSPVPADLYVPKPSEVSVTSHGVEELAAGHVSAAESQKYDEYAMLYTEARLKGYEGDPCPECGSLTLLRNGACLKCDSCGATTGCS